MLLVGNSQQAFNSFVKGTLVAFKLFATTGSSYARCDELWSGGHIETNSEGETVWSPNGCRLKRYNREVKG